MQVTSCPRLHDSTSDVTGSLLANFVLWLCSNLGHSTGRSFNTHTNIIALPSFQIVLFFRSITYQLFLPSDGTNIINDFFCKNEQLIFLIFYISSLNMPLRTLGFCFEFQTVRVVEAASALAHKVHLYELLANLQKSVDK